MAPPTGTIELQSIRALAHQMYCQCQILYKPLSKSVRMLRNKLEEVDEAFGEATIRWEDIRVLQAAGESRDVLDKLDITLQHYQSSSADESAVAEFLTRVDAITHRLSDALEALQQRDRDVDQTIRKTKRSPVSDSASMSMTSSDQERLIRPTSSVWSSGMSSVNVPDRMSQGGEAHLDEEKEVMATQATPSPKISEGWRTLFSFSDPMSTDIDKASSMILSRETSVDRGSSRSMAPSSDIRAEPQSDWIQNNEREMSSAIGMGIHISETPSQSAMELDAPLFQENPKQRLHIRAERQACQVGDSRLQCKQHWNVQLQKKAPTMAHSIEDPKIISPTAAKALWKFDQDNARSYLLDPNHSRAMALCYLCDFSQSTFWQEKNRAQIDASAFENDGRWPMVFDPYFAMANVAQGRLHASECNFLILQLLDSNSALKIPKTPLSRSKRTCFTCQDLRWLVQTLRECLTRLEIEWSEASNAQETCFRARYSSVEDRVGMTNFYPISLLRLSFRSGYGIEITFGGSSRVKRTEAHFVRGVHSDESKKIKTLIRNYMNAAAVKHEAKLSREMALPVASINGVSSLHTGVSSRATSKTFWGICELENQGIVSEFNG